MKYNKTKIIATYGPACSSAEVLHDMIQEGVDVFRFNFSHGDYDFHREGFNSIKAINKRDKSKVAILADIQGPKIRVGMVEFDSLELAEGDEIIVTSIPQVSNKDKVYISYDRLAQDLKVGETILMDDGKLKLRTVEIIDEHDVKMVVIDGGILSSKKGVNMPDTVTTVPSITEKDWSDIKFAVENRANWIALSFVRKPEDVLELKNWLGERNAYIKIIAKIEKPEAVTNIDAIIDVSDGIMVARGDLAVEVPMEKVPLIQKSIARKCNEKGKPVIIATQMMDSMTIRSTPTRAEITDVANAVIDGADALMLSGETSVGKFPVKTIETMTKIITNVENSDIIYHNKKYVPSEILDELIPDSICFNAVKLSEDLHAKAILGMTRSGYTAFRVSSYRPKANLYIFTDNKPLLYTFSLIWGVRGFYYEGFEGTDKTINDIIEILKHEKLVCKGDIVINTASMPLQDKGKTNTIKVTLVKDMEEHLSNIVYDNI